MNELHARLARLRREQNRALATPSGGDTTPSPGLPGWLTSRLDLRSGVAEAARLADSRMSTGEPLELVEQQGPLGRFAARTRDYAAGYLHGDWRLEEALAASPTELAWLARDPGLAELAPAHCTYLDIETTGLSGGAGTIPFLVALGRFRADGTFRLWQAFLRDPGEEAAALAEVAAQVREASGVVSFFGKSFDRHRLEDKMRLHRIEPPFGGKPHLDLYHPLARLYRGAWMDSRLATFERELCGVERVHDLHGSLAPAAWFDFLAGRPHRLEAVFTHNELDVLSLVGLTAHLGRTRAETRTNGRPLSGCAHARARGLAKLHVRAREHSSALGWFQRARERGASDDGELTFSQAECQRRLGQHELSLSSFARLARDRDDALAARAWAEVARLAQRLGEAELLAEALLHGPFLVERTMTGRARACLLARFARLS